MRTIATLQDPDAGEIHLDEIDVLKDKTAVRKLLGYLPRSSAFIQRYRQSPCCSISP